MPLQSMTGFARAVHGHEATQIAWELKSVNGKGLEARLRLPPGFDRLDQPVRRMIQQSFSRGNVQASLSLLHPAGSQQPIVNEALLKDLAELAQRLEQQFGARPARADGLLALRGVLEMPEQIYTDAEKDALDAAILTTLGDAVASLRQSRREEGDALAAVLSSQLDAIDLCVSRAAADPSREPAAIRARLAEQVSLLAGSQQGLDEARLHAEAAILATKADIREEIDRLTTHVASARRLLQQDGPVGRKLDFLAQEFNREANTLCSKSNAATVTAIGLELKVVVDQFREQVQNVE